LGNTIARVIQLLREKYERGRKDGVSATRKRSAFGRRKIEDFVTRIPKVQNPSTEAQN
jgi:hypothetical protein